MRVAYTVGETAPVQSPYGTVAWSEHVEAWDVYSKRHQGQSAERIAERAGFGYGELTTLLGHEPTTYIRQ
jgi:hypothetical protein